MRRVMRTALPAPVAANLVRRQGEVDRKRAEGTLDVTKEWKNARQSSDLQATCSTLVTMAGSRARCMYCMDSHGTDIDHFRPKAPFPEFMFVWPNLLLCCAECGRLKGDRFPQPGGQPLLVDPTAEDPWEHLDFDPITGNLTARFDTRTNDYSPRGSATAELLQLDRREAMAEGYKKTLRRLASIVDRFLAAGATDASRLNTDLQEADDHGLLGWCLAGSGQTLSPFRELRLDHPGIWRECVAVYSSSASA